MIYFIRSYNEFVKIGRSYDVQARIIGLQTGSPRKLKVMAVMEGHSQTEIGLHQMFEKHRAQGEWFRLTQELKWFIRAVQEHPSENNIKTLYKLSLQMRISAKAKRLGKTHKLAKELAKFSSQT